MERYSVLAVIVSMNPDLTLLKKNIQAFYHDVDHVIIWSNSDFATNQVVERALVSEFEGIELLGDGLNRGISYGLNQGWKYAKEHHYNVLLTMDQDSIFEDFRSYRDDVEALWHSKGYCVCGPLARKSKSKKHFVKVSHVITSGMLVPVELLDKANGYCSEFFVDGIDVELCIHLRRLGYRSYCDTRALLKQQYGIPQSRKILWKTLHSAGYGPKRLYGIFRNHIIIFRRYGHPMDLLWHIFSLYFFSFVVKGVLFIEHDKKAKLSAVWHGIVDGMRYDLKKYK